MHRQIQTIRESKYGRAIVVLSTGQVAAAAIPMLAAPILGRLYRPEDYAILALYVAFTAVFAGASTLQFQNGVLVVRSERQADAMASLSLISAFAVSFIAAAVATVVWAMLRQDPAYGAELNWLFMLPLSVLSASVALTGDVVMNRRQKFGALAKLQVLAAATSVATTIALGFLGWGAAGVMVGYTLGEIIRTWGYLRLLRSFGVRLFAISRRGLARLASRHRSFPQFTLPAMLMASMILQMPVFVLSWLGATVLLGSFNRAQRLVALPFLLVGTAIGQVFRQQASQDWRDTRSCRRIYIVTAAILAAIGAPPMVILLMFGPELFELVLGPNWIVAGEIARILAPMLFLRTVAAPLEAVFQFTGNQRTALKLNVVFFLLILCGTVGPILLALEPMAIIWGFVIASSVAYGISLALSWRCCWER